MSGAVLDKHFESSSINSTINADHGNMTIDTDDPFYGSKVSMSIALSFVVGIYHLLFGTL